MRDSFREIAQFMDSVVTPTGLRELIDIHRWHPEYPEEEKSFRVIHNRHNSGLSVEQSFLFLNTYLMDVKGATGLIDTFFNTSKPAVNDRAVKIGELVRDNYDIALLTEIFEDNIKDKVLNVWSARNKPFVIEDSKWSTQKSSGLVNIVNVSLNRPRIILYHEKLIHNFDAESSLWEDGLAAKGIMMSRIGVESTEASIELYNTHLDASDASVRTAQVAEIVQFIIDTHKEENVVILAGDFNIGSRTDEYINLITSLESLGLKDIWAERNRTPGYTTLPGDDDIIVGNQVCQRDDDNSQFCDDFNVPSLDSYLDSRRIDYIFISNPSSSHAFDIDYTRPRRIRHKRRSDAPDLDKITFLSDHFGLTTTLQIVPR
ncbi:hypothetical protein [Maribacter sp. 6B07]|uniref:hypothetical protein n=1 Tax=Maribacter sp. 6B07 TaxID=2045442 RepID=UPI00117C4442|nr:hypothetical protein [Maribacter sp. 6B07]